MELNGFHSTPTVHWISQLKTQVYINIKHLHSACSIEFNIICGHTQQRKNRNNWINFDVIVCFCVCIVCVYRMFLSVCASTLMKMFSIGIALFFPYKFTKELRVNERAHAHINTPIYMHINVSEWTHWVAYFIRTNILTHQIIINTLCQRVVINETLLPNSIAT